MNDPNKARRLPDETTVWTWLKRLNDFGPRLTGNVAHRESIDFIESELTAIGLKVVRDRLRFARWEARACELALLAPDGSATRVEPTSCFPYSGMTPPEGVEGELVYYRWPPWSFAAAAGKIAVVSSGRRRALFGSVIGGPVHCSATVAAAAAPVNTSPV